MKKDNCLLDFATKSAFFKEEIVLIYRLKPEQLKTKFIMIQWPIKIIYDKAKLFLMIYKPFIRK